MRRMWGAVAVFAAVTLTSCSSNDSPAAAPSQPPATTVTTTVTATVTATPTLDRVALEKNCRNAIRADYEAGWEGTDKWPPSVRKPVCAHLDRPTIQRLMDEAIADITEGTGP